MTHHKLQVSFRSTLDPKTRSFVCCGKVYLYYKIRTSHMYIQGDFDRYIKDKLFRHAVDGFIDKATKIYAKGV